MSEAPTPTLLRRLWLRALATAGVTAAVLLSWWWKVEDARTPEDAPAAAFGAALDLGRTAFTPVALDWHPAEGKLVLSALIENRTGETQVAVFGGPPHPPELVLDGVPQEPPQVILRRDDEPLQDLQPRLSEEIALVWPAPPDWQPAPVRIDFDRQAFKLRDNLYGQSSWLGFSPAARLTATPGIVP
ncbi:hypothetical protein [Paracoccus zhejiangensis]|uniref:Uncharacterized protein n=1 Tax=Paracoccus zhejiangensis TaxID=1077935 RepID=A0A2H5EZU4_9RHOB|nr:hypothetical protein [Paracoccus zhejiangensis]AUH64812.1 hypothetical protein CX676_12065 [Paracoccus zhejiangensis]